MDERAALAELHARLESDVDSRPEGLPWPDFMRRALYEPDLGYYERSPRPVGRSGDFFTSVSVGSVFGELLGFQILHWMDSFPGEGESDRAVVEAGAHDGRLADDVLGVWDRLRPSGVPWRYRIVEPSPRRQLWQRERLGRREDRVAWEPALSSFRGVLVANELLDAFPVERLVWDGRECRWRRSTVRRDGSRFLLATAEAGPELEPFLPELPSAVLAVLPDGFTTEVSPEAEAWWQRAAESLESGWLVTLDYGLTDLEWFTPARSAGTLRAYRHHRRVDDPVEAPGTADLTAHVHFDRIRRVGERSGLSTVGIVEQRQFLTRIMSRTLDPGCGFGEWTSDRVRQFQTLTHPEHLGRAFRVLVQRRGGD